MAGGPTYVLNSGLLDNFQAVCYVHIYDPEWKKRIQMIPSVSNIQPSRKRGERHGHAHDNLGTA